MRGSGARSDRGTRINFGVESPKKTDNSPATLLIVFLAVLATVLCYQVFVKKYNSGLRSAVAKRAAALFPESRISIGSVTKRDTDRIELSDVVLREPGRSGQVVFTAQRVVLEGDLDISNWAQDSLAVKRVHLHGAVFRVWPTSAGRWSVDALRPHSKPDTHPPSILVNDASVEIWKTVPSAQIAGGPESRPIRIHDLEAKAISSSNAQGSWQYSVSLAAQSEGIIDALELDGRLLCESRGWQVTGSYKNLRLRPEILRRLPAPVSGHVEQLSGLECVLNGRVEAGAANVQKRLWFRAGGRLSSGVVQHPKLPYRLEEVAGTYFITDKLIQLRGVNAQNAETKLAIDADMNGLSLGSPLTVAMKAERLSLDSRLYRSLPSKLQGAWQKLQLGGIVSGDIRLHYDGHRWHPTAEMVCEGARIKPWLFPYQLTDIRGPISYRDNTVSSSGLTGQAGGQAVSASFSLSHRGNEWFGRIDGASAGAITIDDDLIAGLTPRDSAGPTGAETFVRSLSPTGSIELRSLSFTRMTLEQPNWEREVDAYVYNARIKYDLFPYPIYDIRGRVHNLGANWTLDKFEGRNDSSRIACSGYWEQTIASEVPFNLEFEALGLTLEEELLGALPTDAQHIWRELRPDGSLDRVRVKLQRTELSPRATTLVEITENAADNRASGRSLRIHPRGFAYRLSDVACNIKYTPGRVEIYKASGRNRSSVISLLGRCQPLPDGRWQADVQWLPQTRLMVDKELLTALPQSIRDSLVKIDFRGPISVLGTSQIAFPNQVFANAVTKWNCQFDLENAQLADGDVIGNLRGTVFMEGSSDGQRVRGSGRLAMDALTVMDVPVFALKGPFVLLDSTLFFGQAVNDALPRLNGETDSRMQAKALAGDFFISGTGRLETGKFEFTSQLKNAELASMLQDIGVERASTKAECNATVSFSGIPWNTQGWSGEGHVQLRNAQLFQLPFMMRLMRVASVSARDDSAFQSADISFKIDGERIPITAIDCSGDLLRLRGEGETNLRREIDLELYAYVGRRISLASVLGPLQPKTQYATTLMAITVDGTLSDPQMERRPLPQFASVQELFPELQ